MQVSHAVRDIQRYVLAPVKVQQLLSRVRTASSRACLQAGGVSKHVMLCLMHSSSTDSQLEANRLSPRVQSG